MRSRWIAVLCIITVILSALIVPVSAGMQTIWVDPVHGDNDHSGSSPSSALATLSAGWELVPKNTTLAHGYRILLLPGNYPEPAIPGYLELAHGTEKNPVIIEAANGSHTAILHGWLTIAQCSHLSLINLDIVTDPGYGGGGNIVHLDGCDHITLKGCTLNGYDGTTRQPQETLKANQVTNLTVENCDISGAFWYALDYVAVRNATITGSKVHDAGEFCLLLKGGSSDLRVERNRIYHCDTGGFSAGSGTGFNWMVSPYLHYELYNTKFVNNILHDTGVVGISANGGYNVLIAYNTLYRTGHDNHLFEVMHGRRGCDGDTAACQRNRLSGGWGNAGAEGEYIPSAHVYVYNNLMYNPPGYASRWEQMAVQGAVTPPSNSNVPLPDVVDRDLQIRGNMIWNGPPDLTLLGGDGCRRANLVCNETRILRDNTINQLKPELISPDHGDFTPSANSTVLYSPAYAIPPFPGNDRPSPPLAHQGDLNNLVTRDFFGDPRGKMSFAGAILPVSSPVAGFTATPRSGTAPLTVRFEDTSTKSPTSWKWMFGDGSRVNATAKNPVHTYAETGMYTVSLKAANAYGNTTVTKTRYITVIARPTVTAISPASGPMAGGTRVTVTGTKFTGATAVRFGTMAGTALTVNSSTKITVRSPAHAAGVVDVTVTTPGGTTAISTANRFTYT